MGLLDKLVKEGTEILKEVATEENKEKAADLLNSLKGAFEEHKDELKQFAESFQMETKTEEYKESYFEEVDDGLVESSEWLVFVVASRIVGTSTVEYVTTTITCLVFGDSLFEGEREDADNQRRPSLSYGHLPLYGERAMRNVCLVILQIGFHFGFLGRILRPTLFLVGI